MIELQKKTAVEKRWELNLQIARIYGWTNITQKKGVIYYGGNPKYVYLDSSRVVSKIPNYVNNLGNLMDVLHKLHYGWGGDKWVTLVKYFEEYTDQLYMVNKNNDLLYRLVAFGSGPYCMCKAIVKTHEEWESGEGLGVS